MTSVEFHVGASDALHHACRVVRKASAQGACIVVTGDAQQLDRLDDSLWRMRATDFVAHCRSAADGHVLRRSRVVLDAGAGEPLPHHQVLINVSNRVPDRFEQFERLIEIIDPSEAAIAAARVRWSGYRRRGYPLKRHEMGNGAT